MVKHGSDRLVCRAVGARFKGEAGLGTPIDERLVSGVAYVEGNATE